MIRILISETFSLLGYKFYILNCTISCFSRGMKGKTVHVYVSSKINSHWTVKRGFYSAQNFMLLILTVIEYYLTRLVQIRQSCVNLRMSFRKNCTCHMMDNYMEFNWIEKQIPFLRISPFNSQLLRRHIYLRRCFKEIWFFYGYFSVEYI